MLASSLTRLAALAAFSIPCLATAADTPAPNENTNRRRERDVSPHHQPIAVSVASKYFPRFAAVG